ELAGVGDISSPSRSQEEVEGPAIRSVVTDRLVAPVHELVAALPFARVVEEALLLVPAVEVAVLFTCGRIAEDHDHRRLTRRADAALLLAAEVFMQLRPAD